MYDSANTLDGRYGFVAKYPDGSTVSEREHVWDDVPPGIASVVLMDFASGTQLLELAGFEQFFFANEAVAVRIQGRPGPSTLSAKLLGGVKNGLATECRLDLLGDKPVGSQRSMKAAELPYSPGSFRAGV